MISDVAILGGGVAGSAAALTLLRGGARRVRIIEPSRFAKERIGETIPPDATVLLRQLGVFESFAAAGHLPCHGNQSLWGSNQLGHNDFLVSPYGYGWHLDRKAFDRMLFEAAIAAGAEHVPNRCRRVEVMGDKIAALSLADGSSIPAGFVIDASGRNAILPRALGIDRRVDDTQLVIWARFHLKNGKLGNATWLEGRPYGWWYAAELPGSTAIVALGTDPAIAKSLGATSISGWAVLLSETLAIAPLLEEARLKTDSFGMLAAQSYLTKQSSGANWAAVGDAASALDPLSSAGIYKALANGVQLGLAMLNGRDLDAYSDNIAQDYLAYLDAREALYSLERRWLDQPFWQKRCQVPA